ncbi:RING-type E3 ubiquitin transferase [Citrus sinensis]|uniref:RING-type E3 ubiquitin transferase n=1 Tax=Citrus sinensis TaxID=2711 RepID=A0ACB8N9A9_CITSI|nr:RING-type E3 ubiquitin transferase [Citrus sinensis]
MPGKRHVRLINLAKWLVESAWVALRLFQERCEEELLWAAEMIKIKAQDLKGKEVRVNTSLLYQQTKFNLQQEKSEGYAKLGIPMSSVEVLEINSKITAACKSEDQTGGRDLVAKIKKWIKESERNKRCIVDYGAVSVLAAAFESFSKTCLDEHVSVLEEILSTLTLLFPLAGEALTYLGSASSMHCMVWFLKSGDLSRRRNTVLVLREVISSDHRRVNMFLEIEGAIESLYTLIKEPICPTATEASFVVVYHMITSASAADKPIQKFVDMGLPMREALGVLDGLCSSDYGRGEAYNNSLIFPVITEFSVSILWKLCKNEKREEKTAFVEALQVGAFQKLLLLLQVGCADKTKGQVTELLKLLNLHRARWECIDSMDFKSLKRPF